MSVAVKESYWWQQTKAGLDSPEVHLTRLENSVGNGVSDVSACSHGVEIFIELKVTHGSRIHFRASQRAWITRRCSVGGRIFVLVRDGERMLLYDGLAAVTITKFKTEKVGAFSVLLEDMPVPLFECHKPFKWQDLRAKLFVTET